MMAWHSLEDFEGKDRKACTAENGACERYWRVLRRGEKWEE
jgi:hypothetical protein